MTGDSRDPEHAASPAAGAQHRQLRQLLGSYALGHLEGTERDAMETHLRRCGSCRHEVDELAPVVARLNLVDPSTLQDQPLTPDLSARLRGSVERESATAAARRSSGAPLGRAALLLAAAAFVAVAAAGSVVGRLSAPEPDSPPLESIELAQTDPSPIEVTRADLVAHTWGVELRMTGAGFTEGRTYRAFFVAESEQLVPAGEFRGTGSEPMVCFLQSAALRGDVTAVIVRDDGGRAVLRAGL